MTGANFLAGWLAQSTLDLFILFPLFLSRILDKLPLRARILASIIAVVGLRQSFDGLFLMFQELVLIG